MLTPFSLEREREQGLGSYLVYESILINIIQVFYLKVSYPSWKI